MSNNNFNNAITGKIKIYDDKYEEKLKNANVSNELHKYAMNEYVNKDLFKNIIGKDENTISTDEINMDDLLLTNKIGEDIEKDKLDKTRYIKIVRSYINVHSSVRNIKERKRI